MTKLVKAIPIIITSLKMIISSVISAWATDEAVMGANSQIFEIIWKKTIDRQE